MSWNLNKFWPLNESSDGSGPVARVDLVGGVELTDVNTVASGEGPNGNTPGAANIVRVNDERLAASDSTLFDFEDSGESWAFLFHLRINNQNDTVNHFITKSGASGTQYYCNATQQLTRWAVRKSAGVEIVQIAGALSTATWHKVMTWYDHTTGEIGIWVDGTAATSTVTPLWSGRGAKFIVGSYDGAPTLNMMDGRIANLGYRSTVWTADEKTEFNSKFMTAEDFGIGAASGVPGGISRTMHTTMSRSMVVNMGSSGD